MHAAATIHWLSRSIFLLALALVISCSSSPPAETSEAPAEPTKKEYNVSPVLTPVETESEEALSQKRSVVNPKFHEVMQLLQALGYEGLGLEYETEEVYDLLIRVFRDPLVANRQLRLVYTGLQMSYDKKHQSLTIGGLRDPIQVLVYIQKNVPLVPVPQEAVTDTTAPAIAPVISPVPPAKALPPKGLSKKKAAQSKNKAAVKAGGTKKSPAPLKAPGAKPSVRKPIAPVTPAPVTPPSVAPPAPAVEPPPVIPPPMEVTPEPETLPIDEPVVPQEDPVPPPKDEFKPAEDPIPLDTPEPVTPPEE
jgi:hypothetical protein